MNVSSALKFFSRRSLVSGVVGLILTAAPFLMATAAAGDPYEPPNDVAAYQSYTAGTAQSGQPMPSPAERNRLEARLNYAEAQYARAREVGDRGAAKHWKRNIKHLTRELSAADRAEGSGYGAPAYLPFQGPYNASAGPAYPQPYPPTMPPYGYPGAPAALYPSAGYPPSGYPAYPNGAGAFSYGTPGATGSTGGLSSLLGPLLGGGSALSAAPYPSAGYPQAGYPGAAAGSPYGAPAATGSMGGLSSLLGPLLGGGSIP
jgi:hypothetical protein